MCATTRPVFDLHGRFSHFIDGRDYSLFNLNSRGASLPPSRVAREPAFAPTALWLGKPAGSGEGSFPLPSCDAAGRCFNLDACFEMVDVVELGEGRA